MPDTPLYRCHDARKTQIHLDLLNRLTRAALLYMHDADPKNGVPRTIVFQSKNILLNLCDEANTLLCASAPPRETPAVLGDSTPLREKDVPQ